MDPLDGLVPDGEECLPARVRRRLAADRADKGRPEGATDIPRVEAALRQAALLRQLGGILVHETNILGAQLLELRDAMLQSAHGHQGTHPDRDREPGPPRRRSPAEAAREAARRRQEELGR